MALFRFLLIATGIFTVSACSQMSTFSTPTKIHIVRETPHQKQGIILPTTNGKSHSTKRINTTQCNDRDDWYLDGYRVGYSFSSQKAAMLQERMRYCQLTRLPNHFKASWEQGYNIGSRQATPKRK